MAVTTRLGPDLEAVYEERYEGDYMSAHSAVELWRVGEVLRSIPLPENPAIVDYGCGRGRWITTLLDAFPGASVTGVDISSTAIAEARRAYPEHDFEAFDGARAPVEDASSDLVFSYHVLEHVVDLPRTLADMSRMARPGGYVVAILPCANRGSLEELATRLVDGGVERSVTGETRFAYEDPTHLRRLTSEQLAAGFADHGCELAHEFYARHLAAVSYLSPATVRDIFEPRRARSAPAALALATLRFTLLCAAAVVKLHQTPRARLTLMARSERDARKRLVALVALAAQPLLKPVGAALELQLPRREWRRTSSRRRGAAAQFLVFRKRGR
jgi:trans-aconitate methyltransferase